MNPTADSYLIESTGNSSIPYANPIVYSSTSSVWQQQNDIASLNDENGDGVLDLVFSDDAALNHSIVLFSNQTIAVKVSVLVEYVYDALGRLVKVKKDGSEKTDYDYDPAGNRTGVTDN